MSKYASGPATAGKNLLVVMDPIQNIYYHKDTTLALLWAARDRGWQLFYAEQRDLYLLQGKAMGRLRRLEVFRDPEGWFSLGEHETVSLADMQTILIDRKSVV